MISYRCNRRSRASRMNNKIILSFLALQLVLVLIVMPTDAYVYTIRKRRQQQQVFTKLFATTSTDNRILSILHRSDVLPLQVSEEKTKNDSTILPIHPMVNTEIPLGNRIGNSLPHIQLPPITTAVAIVIVALSIILISMFGFVDPVHAESLPTTSLLLSDVTTSTTGISVQQHVPLDWKFIFDKATKKALGGGKAGAFAAIVQVVTLMWLRTCMNYQYRYGGTLQSSLQTLYQQGGIQRLYDGLPFAIIQGPLTRFGDTAANVGILALFDAIPITQALPLPIKTLCGSITAGLWRIVLMPIDTSKTSLQVEGTMGLQKLWNTTLEYGPSVLYRGSLAQAAATAVGHFPWFLTYNFFNDIIPIVDATTTASITSDPNIILFLSLGRSALLGLLASCVSDCSSNSLRVIKTTKQTAQLNDSVVITSSNSTTSSEKNRKELTYPEVIQLIIEQDGITGLFGRGLQTRLLTNAIQGSMFSVLWKYFQQLS